MPIPTKKLVQRIFQKHQTVTMAPPRAALSPLLWVLAVIAAAAPVSADDSEVFLTAVKEFDMPLSELTKGYLSSSLQTLPKFPSMAAALTACQRHHKEIESKIDKAKSTNDAAVDNAMSVCDKVRYFSEVQHLTDGVRNRGQEVVLTKSDETSYSQLFVDYMEVIHTRKIVPCFPIFFSISLGVCLSVCLSPFSTQPPFLFWPICVSYFGIHPPNNILAPLYFCLQRPASRLC
jgi:hypothetical protein